MNQFLNQIFARTDRMIALTTITAFLFAILFFRPWVWDATSYHLPFAARELGIQNYLGISNLYDGRYKGFPVLWRYALGPGLILNSPRLYILPNIAAALSVGYCLHRLLNISKLMAIAATLCFPITYLGFASAYQDYFTNAFILMGGLLAARGIFSLIFVKHDQGIVTLWGGFACLAVAANTKIQGIILSVTILTVTVIYAILLKIVRLRQIDEQVQQQERRENWTTNKILLFLSSSGNKQRILKLGISLALLSLIFYQPLSNLKHYNNPFYPVETLGFKGPETQYSTPLEYIPPIPIMSNFLSHYLSILEIDPYILPRTLPDGRKFLPPRLRSLDMYSMRIQRTGGSIGIIYAGMMALLLINAFRIIKSKRIHTFNESLAVFLPLTSIFISFLPQSLDLRYYLVGLFIASIGSLALSTNQKLLDIAKGLILIGLLISLPHLVIRARKILTPDRFLNLQSELPTTEQCIQLGELSVNREGRKVLRLNPQTVPDNVPFQCRLVMPESIYIDYCEEPCTRD
ncbi:MAG: hypothetical protein ACO394_06060 [Blastocatellia bacterium]